MQQITFFYMQFQIVLAIFCAVIPDADAIGFKLGIAYQSVQRHKQRHYPFFFLRHYFLFWLFIFKMGRKKFSKHWAALISFFFVVTASHSVLDAMTNGRLGITFFASFNNTRYFFPFQPIQISPSSITKFFTERGWCVLQSEFVWIWIPSFIIIAISYLVKKLYSR